MALAGLEEKGLKLILFGGKGGVGKTTCASSTALYLAKDFKTLLISTDPAHSLSDSLGLNIGNEIKELKVVPNLSALEVDADKALLEFKKEYEGEMRHLLGTSTYLDEEDIDSIFTLPIPGIDEVMGFKTIVDLIEKTTHEKYIVDTAPTGHALRLLTLPGLLDDWLKVMAKMRWKYRYVVERFTGTYKEDKTDDLLLSLKKSVNRMKNLLQDQNKCEFIVVTIPAEMAILETERLIEKLMSYGMRVAQLIINNVMEPREKCEFCQEKSKEEQKYINHIREKFNKLGITIMPLQAEEIKGMEKLNRYKKLLFNE
jgi:arsenite-transporting ATPase